MSTGTDSVSLLINAQGSLSGRAILKMWDAKIAEELYFLVGETAMVSNLIYPVYFPWSQAL